jgi:hypothetical protein
MRRITFTWRWATARINLLRIPGTHYARVTAARRCLPASVFGQRPFLSALAMQGDPSGSSRVLHRPAIGFQSSKTRARAHAAHVRTGAKSSRFW